MADFTLLEALQAFHQELVAIREKRADPVEVLNNELLVNAFENELGRFWSRPTKNETSRKAVNSGKITVHGDEYSVNPYFQQSTIAFADEVDLDELEAAQYLLESQDDPTTLGRSLLECAIIRFHQQRKYALDCVRLLLELDRVDDDSEEEAREDLPMAVVQVYVAERIFTTHIGDKRHRLLSLFLPALSGIRTWLQKLGDKIAAAQTLGPAGPGGLTEEAETIEFSRVSLIQQHELLGVILCQLVTRQQASVKDFEEFLPYLQRLDRYDHLLVHLIPATGAYLSLFGSPVGGHDLVQARALNDRLFPLTDERPWALPHFQAAVRAWWLAQYSGFYLEEPPEAAIPPGTDLDEEDRQRAKQFQDSVKDGAFDFLLSVAGDAKSPEWHDPVRADMHRWLQRKSPSLAPETAQFSDFFQLSLVTQLEAFVDDFIMNLPDVLRKLRVEEDEQRQLSPDHEQDFEMERFLLIVAYAYEDRPSAQRNFWDEPDSHLHGFLLWASKRASTPLVTAFCEMLQAIASNQECANDAHSFLLDEGHHSTGKMRRVQTLTWNQIFKELNYFLDKAKQKPSQTQTVRYRAGKPSHDIVETEPESAAMLESYLRLITKLATESDTTRQFLLQHGSFNLVETILELASTPIPPKLRGCGFMALKSLLTSKTQQDGYAMWHCLDLWITGGYAIQPTGTSRPPQPSPVASMERLFDEISRGFDDPVAFVQLLLALVAPSVDSSPLNDALPFPENCGSAFRAPGIEVYVDYVIGLVFASKTNDLTDIHQIRVLRLGCLDFILTCLSTFNEDLIVMANETNLTIDSIIATTDLATYVKMHPFARIMEWMLNDKVIAALFNTIHQEPVDVGNAAPDSPLILGILRAIEIISRVLDLQATYTNLVRPIIRQQSSQLRQPASKAGYASFEDGLVTRLSLIVDLGNYVGIGHPELTLACLKLLERMSSSSKIAAVWSGGARYNHRNKAIVAMEANGEHDSISRAFVSELAEPLDIGREGESSAYVTKIYILDFLLQCLLESPNRPTIAHLILGFKCGTDSLSVEPNGSFDTQTSVFHNLLKLLIETPSADAQGMRRWLLALKTRSMQILHVLWSSQISSSIVIDELRANELLFHLLVRETLIHPGLPWEGMIADDVSFTVADGSIAFIDFLTLRRMTFEYVAMELCMISQGRMPSVKRRIFEALNGQVTADGNELLQTPTVFDLYDFKLNDEAWQLSFPPLKYYQDLDPSVCLETDADGNSIYNITRVEEIIMLQRRASNHVGTIATTDDPVTEEEKLILNYLISINRQRQLAKLSLMVLRTWVKLLLVMVECNDFKGTDQTSFFLQALQAILPHLELYSSEQPEEASELAKLAKVLLSKLHLAISSATDKDSLTIGNLISDKLYQLFQICLQAIGKWAGTTELRTVYYEICYRYLTTLEDGPQAGQGRSKTIKTIQMHGERLMNVICDDAYGGEPLCQVAALMLLGILINFDQREGETHVIETLNRLNFIGVLVDSLKNIMQEWNDVFAAGYKDQENFQRARLALLLQLVQTRAGAKHILHANLLRTIEYSGLFSADPDLQTRSDNPRALEQHYDLLAKVVRIIGAALVSRGSHNVVQGRRFLTENRMLVSHTLKRASGIGADGTNEQLEEKVNDLADSLMILITATGFLEFENEGVEEPKQQQNGSLFH